MAPRELKRYDKFLAAHILVLSVSYGIFAKEEIDHLSTDAAILEMQQAMFL